ncbi:MAG: Fic family protein [bacterium]
MNHLDKRIQNIPQKLWAIINMVDELKGRWVGGASLNPQVLTRLKKSVLVTSTGASTRIEGSGLSDEDVDRLIRGLTMQKFKDRDKQEVRGYYELLENIFSAYEKIAISESSIKHLHKELLKHVDKDTLHRGDYKKDENQVEMINGEGKSVAVIFATTPALLTPKEMYDLMDWTRKSVDEKKIHPLIIIANFIIEFLKIHPFEDGNGRLSRILTNLLMLQYGYEYVPYISHEKLIEDNKPEYYVALRQSQKTFKTENEDIFAWLEFFLNISLTQAKEAIALLSKENIEKLLSPKQLLVWQYLLSVPEATPGDISKSAKVARPTVSQALDTLLRLKKVERIGQGRTTRYKKT